VNFPVQPRTAGATGKEDITPQLMCPDRKIGTGEKSGRTVVIQDEQDDKFRTVGCLEDMDPFP
jgi:hypothetical protein